MVIDWDWVLTDALASETYFQVPFSCRTTLLPSSVVAITSWADRTETNDMSREVSSTDFVNCLIMLPFILLLALSP